MKKNSDKKNFFRAIREDMEKALVFYGEAMIKIYG